MQYFYIEPEVAGGLGENTVLDSSSHPPMVEKLHYQFDGWLGDVFLESFPCFVTTEYVVQALQAAAVTGVSFSDMEVSTSDEFQEKSPGKVLPKFIWLKVSGRVGVDDFGIADDLRLVVSNKVLDILGKFGLTHALIEQFS